MKHTRIILKSVSVSLFSLAALALHSMAIAANGPGGSGGVSLDASLDSRFDTSFAIEYSYSCLSGGCHEADTQLVEEHAGTIEAENLEEGGAVIRIQLPIDDAAREKMLAKLPGRIEQRRERA